MTSAQADPLIDRLIDGRYHIRSRIARGGMATVYLATDLRLERRVAIKVMHGHLADDAAFKTRFIQEARSAARLAHPNVVNVFDQGQDTETAYMVMEYLPGITLRDLLKERGHLSPRQAIEIIKPVVAGLAAAHDSGIVHRDLKPENVLLADDGRIKLGDFGLARAANTNTATGQALLGTIAYLSPELVTGGLADTRSDVYSIGIMLYEALTGEQPHVGDQPMQVAYKHANEPVPPPSAKMPTVPRELDELVLWATTREPSKRPHDARELLEALKDAERAIPVPANAAPQRTKILPAGETEKIPPADLPYSQSERGSNLTASPDLTAPIGRDETLAPQASNHTAAITSRRRRPVRLWVVLGTILVVLGLIAAGSLYFTVGPGGLVDVPKVDASNPDAAEKTLEAAGFRVVREQQHNVKVPTGALIKSIPDLKGSVRRDTTFKFLLSLGPQMFPIPDVLNKSEADAKSALSKFSLLDSIFQYNKDVTAGNVLAVLDANKQPAPTPYPEQGQIILLVSAGPLPSVTGLGKADAEAKLKEAGVTVNYGEAVFSDTVARDVVVSEIPESDPLYRGGSVTLVVSKGPDVIELPNVINGQTIKSARKQLEDLKYDLVVKSNIPAFAEGAVVATVQSPAAGTLVRRGSQVEVNYTQ